MNSRARAHCPSFEAISRAFSAGDPGLLGPHLSRCASCGSAWRDLEAIKRAGQALPWQAPSDERAAQLEDELLIRARAEVVDRDRRDRRLRAAALGAGVALAAGILVAVLWLSPDRSTPEWPADPPPIAETSPLIAPPPPALAPPVVAPVQRGTIRPRGGAKFEHFTRHAAAPGLRADEVVHVAAGTVQVDVAPLARDERFRVVTLDAEVEVRGTSFEVEVEQDRLIAVRVTSGLVEVRPRDGAPRMLSAGQSWRHDEPEAVAVVEEKPVEKPVVVPVEDLRVEAPPAAEIPDATPAIPEPAPNESELAFEAGWELLKNGDAAGAAEKFAAIDDGGALSEDAMYWRAVALARAKKYDEAEATMRSFLDRFSSSVRAGEVSVMLGRRLLDRGAFGEARLRFSAAQSDPSSRVRKAAETGLADLDQRRPE